jgi:hypothetical protein
MQAGSPSGNAGEAEKRLGCLVRYPQQRTFHFRPRPVCLSPSCTRSANNEHTRGNPCVLTLLDLATRDVRAVTKNWLIDCNEPARNLLPGCLVWFSSESQFSERSRRNGGAPRGEQFRKEDAYGLRRRALA